MNEKQVSHLTTKWNYQRK